MMKKSMIVSVLAAALLSGCVIVSIQPFYQEDQVVWKKELLGEWTDGEDASWLIEKSGNKTYRVRVKEGEEQPTFYEVRLFQVKKSLLMDITADQKELDRCDLATMPLVKGHLLARVDSIEPELKVRFLNAKKVKEIIDSAPGILSPVETEDFLVLTTPPTRLQAFFHFHGDQPDLFGEPVVMEKK